MRIIDADELIKNDPFHKCHGKCNLWWDGYLKAANEAYVAVKNAPTIDAVEVVHGDWYGVGNMYMCTVCGEQVYVSTNYCPNCGAKMDGGT